MRILASPESIAGGASNCKTGELCYLIYFISILSCFSKWITGFLKQKKKKKKKKKKKMASHKCLERFFFFFFWVPLGRIITVILICFSFWLVLLFCKLITSYNIRHQTRCSASGSLPLASCSLQYVNARALVSVMKIFSLAVTEVPPSPMAIHLE